MAKTSRLTDEAKKTDQSQKFYKSKILNIEAAFVDKIAKKGKATLRGLQPASGLKIQNRFLADEFLPCLNVYNRLVRLLTI